MIIAIIILTITTIILSILLYKFQTKSQKYHIYNKETNETILMLYIQGNRVETNSGRQIVVKEMKDMW